ncbi:MAG: 4Fe-4S dicluster domain-containing protein [Desulfamplus sp.]|nr:4Fe-4S dicluster domain-containing protein [Desulfamplus sp.]
MKNQKIYRQLQEHLNKMPVGFPATKSGADIKLLMSIFTPEEAKIARFLTYKLENIEQIFDRLKQSSSTIIESHEHLAKILDRIQKKGGIESKIKDGVRYYCNAPLVVGIYEMQVNRLTPEFLENFNQYSSDINFALEFLSTKKPQMRTIPIQKSITPTNHVSHFDEVVKLFENAESPFVVLECICRKKRALEEKPCKVTNRQETCIAVGEFASTALLMNIGREISRDNAISIIEQNQKEGLVLQPSNTEKIEFICSCCGCCCGMLSIHKMLPIPVEFWSSNFYAVVDSNACNGCGVCERRCQVGAVKIVDKSSQKIRLTRYGKEYVSPEGSAKAVVDLNVCIGCGLCVPTCSKKAVSLVKKGEETKPPLNREELYEVIMSHKQGTLGRLKTAGRLVKGMIKTGNTSLLKKP